MVAQSTRPAPYQLSAARDYVRAELAALPRPPYDWVQFHKTVDLLKSRLMAELDARFADLPAASVQVEILGVRASSTMGAASAVATWLRKVERQLAVEASHG